MSAIAITRATPNRTPLTPSIVVAAWRGITPRQLRNTILLGGALVVFHALAGPLPNDFKQALVVLVADPVKAFAMLLAIVVADRVTGKDPDRRTAYALAVVTGAVLGAVASVVAITFAFRLLFDPPGGVHPGAGFVLYIGLDLLMTGGAVVWIINDRRRVRRASARLQAAELERIAAQRRSLESDLQAMQARVEPGFLLNTLSQVRALHEADPPRGERMLDELIAYLRAAMPQMRDTSSTVGQEIALAHAYLDIARIRLGDALKLEFACDDSLATSRMPPMMLLPLLEAALARGAGPAVIRVTVRRTVTRLAIAIRFAGEAALRDDDEAFGAIRERLAALYGTNASLAVAQDAGATEAWLELPFDSAVAPASLSTSSRFAASSPALPA